MEIARLSDTSIKIKTKTATLVVDPNTKVEADIILQIVGEDSDSSLVSNNRIVIDGPGDYEIMDVVIKGVRYGEFVGYYVDDGLSRLMLIPSTVVETEKDEEGYNALVVKVVSGFDVEKITSFAPNVCLVFGDPMLVDHATEAEKQQKVNVRRLDEALKGQVIVLRKD